MGSKFIQLVFNPDAFHGESDINLRGGLMALDEDGNVWVYDYGYADDDTGERHPGAWHRFSGIRE
jgi:hypothetical protein